MRRDGNFPRTIMTMVFLGIIGSHVAGLVSSHFLEVGAFIGCLLGLGLGIIVWHMHNWQRQALYDARGEPVVMLKVCECGKIEFDGWFERKEK